MLGLAGDGRGGGGNAAGANLALVRQDGSGGTMNWDQAWYDSPAWQHAMSTYPLLTLSTHPIYPPNLLTHLFNSSYFPPSQPPHINPPSQPPIHPSYPPRDVISSRTGIIEPDIFFQRLNNGGVLEKQIDALKKASEQRLEALKKEVVVVEQDMEESRNLATFAAGPSNKVSHTLSYYLTYHPHLLSHTPDTTSHTPTYTQAYPHTLSHRYPISHPLIRSHTFTHTRIHPNTLPARYPMTKTLT